MTYPIEENLPYAWLAIIVLAVFYAIYFAKMISQKRHGIQTHQIGRVKEKSVHRVEVLMSIATLAAPVISDNVHYIWVESYACKRKVYRFLHRYVR